MRDILAGIPIAGVTGINGAGKTLWAVNHCIQVMKTGRVVYSTVQIKSPWGNSEPIVSLRQLLTLRDCTILLDDVAVIFPASSTSLPPDVVTLLQTLRHVGCDVVWTAPAWMRCHNLLRDVTQGLLNVVPMMRRHDGDNPWPSPRWVRAGLLDTSSGKTDAEPTRVLRRVVAIPTRLDSWGAYDTRADTPMLGRHLHSSRCLDCHGAMDTPKHSPERHAHLGIPFYEDAATSHQTPAIS